MDIPVTFCSVITLQHNATMRARVTHVENFMFFGEERTKAMTEMVHEYFEDEIIGNMKVDDRKLPEDYCDLTATVMGGNYEAQMNDVTISMHWETRL